MDTQSAEDAGDVDLDFGLEVVSSTGDAIEDLGIGTTMLPRLEMSLACFSEKVANLGIFVMHMETMEGELEDLDLDKDDIDMDCVGKVLEFDLLYGVLDSEVRELEFFWGALHAEIVNALERVSYSSLWQEDKLRDYEQLLMQSKELLSEIKKQSVCFQRTLSCYKKEGNGNAEENEITRQDDQSSNVNTEIKMQTVGEQRQILRMLEKSLANEIELEKNFSDLRQSEEKLKQRVVSLEEELVFLEEEATDVWEKWFEEDNAREVLMGISKDLLGRLQISQFNLNGLSQRESELRAKLETCECQLRNVKASADEYQAQYTAMCSQIRDMENLIVELKENVSNAESRANAAESEIKILTETNSELNKELALLKGGGGMLESVELLDRQLKESNLRLQHAVASAEASEEKQRMFYSTIQDMEYVMKDLKSKVSRAESRADSAEENCNILSETNADLNEELSFLRSRLECLEGSLHLAEEARVETAKDIGKQTKVFKTLLMQLAVERERLNKLLSSLASENKILVVKLKQTCKDPSQEVSPTPASEGDSIWKKNSANDNEVNPANSMPDAGTVRRIDAGVISFKHLFISVLVLLISAVAYLHFKDVKLYVCKKELKG